MMTYESINFSIRIYKSLLCLLNITGKSYPVSLVLWIVSLGRSYDKAQFTPSVKMVSTPVSAFKLMQKANWKHANVLCVKMT